MRWFFPVLLAACSPLPDTVVMKGEVRSDIAEDSEPFAGATLTVLDENGKQVARDTANGQGRFTLDVPAGATIHTLIDGDGHITASFSGVSGLQDTFKVDDGALHGLSEAEWAAWTANFAGCPGLGEGGGAVIGEPRVIELVDDNGEHPGVGAAVAELWNPDTEEVIPACYLSAETGLYDPDALATGEAGVFGIFGVPEGTWVLSMGFEAWPGAFTWEDTLVYVPEGGAAPRFPAWVHFPVR